jgi:hypothetical protein
MTDFHIAHYVSEQKADNGADFRAGGLTIAGQIITHSVEIRTNTWYQLYDYFQDNESCDPHLICASSPPPPPPILC